MNEFKFYTLENDQWTRIDEKDVLDLSTEEQDYEIILRKNGYRKGMEVIEDSITIYEQENSDKFIVIIDSIYSAKIFYLRDFVELIKFFNFIGLNFYEFRKQRDAQYSRVIGYDQLDSLNCFDCLTQVVRISDDQLYVQSPIEILTSAEMREKYLRSKRRLEEQSKSASNSPKENSPSTDGIPRTS